MIEILPKITTKHTLIEGWRNNYFFDFVAVYQILRTLQNIVHV